MTVHILQQRQLKLSKPGLKRLSESLRYSVFLNEEKGSCMARWPENCEQGWKWKEERKDERKKKSQDAAA